MLRRNTAAAMNSRMLGACAGQDGHSRSPHDSRLYRHDLRLAHPPISRFPREHLCQEAHECKKSLCNDGEGNARYGSLACFTLPARQRYMRRLLPIERGRVGGLVNLTKCISPSYVAPALCLSTPLSLGMQQWRPLTCHS